MIEVKDLRKSFDGVEVLKGITTTFETGKVNLVIGQPHPLQYSALAPGDVHHQGTGHGHVFERLANVPKSRAHVHA